jgi:cytochrome c
MKTILTAAAAVLALAAPAFAQDEIAGDVEVGAKDWKKCKACHAITDADGETIEKGGKTGPNLWGIVGRQAGTDPEFGKYTDEMVALGEGGLVWDAEELGKYIVNAREYIGAKTSMTPQKLKDVNNVIAFMAQYGPEDAMDDDAAESEETEEEAEETTE